jgi:hypothetical protein
LGPDAAAIGRLSRDLYLQEHSMSNILDHDRSPGA